MAVIVKRMTAPEFEKFQNISTETYISGMLAAGMTRENAAKRAKDSGDKLLPLGLDTKSVILLSILVNAKHAGHFWCNLGEEGGIKSVMIYDFTIYPEFKGHGFSGVIAVKKFLREMSISKVFLHVFAKNERALKLYQALGFQIDSYNMSAKL